MGSDTEKRKRPPYTKERRAALVLALRKLGAEYGWRAIDGALLEAHYPPRPETPRQRKRRLWAARLERARFAAEIDEDNRAWAEREARELEEEVATIALRRSRLDKLSNRLDHRFSIILGHCRGPLRYASVRLTRYGRRLTKPADQLAFEARRDAAAKAAIEARNIAFYKRVGPLIMERAGRWVIHREIALELNAAGMMKITGRPWRPVDVGQAVIVLRGYLHYDPGFLDADRTISGAPKIEETQGLRSLQEVAIAEQPSVVGRLRTETKG